MRKILKTALISIILMLFVSCGAGISNGGEDITSITSSDTNGSDISSGISVDDGFSDAEKNSENGGNWTSVRLPSDY